MSAYVVDRDHIAYLVNMALEYGRWGGVGGATLSWHAWGVNAAGLPTRWATLRAGDYDQGVRVGQMLWDENIKSVRARYPDSPDDLPGPIGEDYVFTRRDLTPFGPRFDAAQVLKSCDCYEYQSCEHEGWEESEAHAFIERLRSAAWRAMPGYDAAEWGAPTKAQSKARR